MIPLWADLVGEAWPLGPIPRRDPPSPQADPQGSAFFMARGSGCLGACAAGPEATTAAQPNRHQLSNNDEAAARAEAHKLGSQQKSPAKGGA